MKLRHVSTAFLATCLLLVCSQGRAEVIATGDVDPSGATDPWEASGNYWEISDFLKVGDTGEGTLNISDGGVVSNTGCFIGYDDDAVGTVTVTGQWSKWINSSALSVGKYGEGTLNIADGGVVSNTWGTIGYWSDAVGTVTVTGEESEWNNSENLSVGSRGNGTLIIEAGGVVSNATGLIGRDDDSVGTVTVTGEGSAWNNSEDLSVGSSGDGTLNIEGGGVVTTSGYSNSYIGVDADSVGTVTVTGKGSEWKNSDYLFVGRGGEGTLDIEAGGVVSNAGGSIGSSSDSWGQ